MTAKTGRRWPLWRPEDPYCVLPHLLGLRGLFTIQAFFFLFFQVFLPDIFSDGSPKEAKPNVRKLVARTFGLFFHPTLIASSFILLSARTSCLPFIKNPTSRQLASSAFHRSTRIVLPLATALTLTSIVNHVTDVIPSIQDFKEMTNNSYLPLPYRLPSALATFNAIFGLFWHVRDYETQAGNLAFYSASLWPISVVYTQSFTVYMTMVCIPFTRWTWRIKTFSLFILTAWWVQSWAWYSITGLLLADAVANGILGAKTDQESRLRVPLIHLGRKKIILCFPTWVPALGILMAGCAFRAVGTNLHPDIVARERNIHASFGAQDDLVAQPLAKSDIYLLVLGFILLAETIGWLQTLLSSNILTSIGRRSLSLYIVASICVNTTGIKLYLHLLRQYELSHVSSASICFVLYLVQTAVFGEVFYQCCERVSDWTARRAFHFFTDASLIE